MQIKIKAIIFLSIVNLQSQINTIRHIGKQTNNNNNLVQYIIVDKLAYNKSFKLTHLQISNKKTYILLHTHMYCCKTKVIINSYMIRYWFNEHISLDPIKSPATWRAFGGWRPSFCIRSTNSETYARRRDQQITLTQFSERCWFNGRCVVMILLVWIRVCSYMTLNMLGWDAHLTRYLFWATLSGNKDALVVF